MEIQTLVYNFNKKVTNGLYETEYCDCLCGADNFRKIAQWDRYGLWNPVVICKNCGLIYANPRLTEETYKSFYSSDEYRAIYEKKTGYLQSATLRFKEKQGRHIFDIIQSHIIERGHYSIFEFGCGGGWNLIHFVEAGFSVSGCDYSPALVAFGRDRGLDLKVGSLDALVGRYDVIILNHVIEHFSVILKSLQEISAHLNPEGLLFIGVPNMDNFGLGQLQNAHTYYFSPRTFDKYMQEAGLRCVEHGEAEGIHMYGVFEVASDEIDNKIYLAKEYNKMIRLVRLARIRSFFINMLDAVGMGNAIREIKKKISK